MKVDPNRCQLVVVGSWNQAIFSSQFVAQTLILGSQQIQYEMGVGPGGTIPKFTGPAFSVLVQPDRVVWTPRSIDDDVLQAMESSIERLLRKLEYTPVTAFGMNFGFDETSASESIELAARVAEEEKLAELGIETRSAQVKRQLNMSGEIVNLTLSKDSTGLFRIDLNFHWDVAGGERILEILDGSSVDRKRRALNLISSLYDLELA